MGKRRHRAGWPGAGCGLVAALAALAAPDTAPRAEGLAWCHDVARDLVTRRPAAACRGRIVDDGEAARIRARRLKRVRRGLGAAPSTMPGLRMAGSGTGLFVAADGALVTNAHVVAQCRGVTVAAADGGTGPARVIAIDERSDLALLDAEVTAPAVAAFGPDREPRPGAPVAVVGFPLHGWVAIKPILVTGRVIGPARPGPGGARRFRLRADVRRGNSGGPVIDGRGRIVGLVVAKVDTPRTFQLTGRLVRDVGVAIANETVTGFLDAHNQPHRHVDTAPPLSDEEIEARADRFVARLVCWR